MTTSIRQAFGETLYKLAKINKNIYVVSADLKSSLFLNKFAKRYPSRFIECGVAENNAAGIAAGLAKTGKTVFLVSFACFSPSINWNTIKQSISYNKNNVKIVGSHAGLLSTDLGATHQMLEDIAIMSPMPNMDVFSPLDSVETEKIITTLSHSPTPAYIRLVRASTPQVYNPKLGFTIGKSHILKTGKDVTIIGHGPILLQALDIKDYSLEVINCSSIKPLDIETIIKSVKKTKKLICIEDHQKIGGLGQIVASALLERGINPKFIHIAVDNKFGQSGHDYQKLYDYYGIGINDLLAAIKKII
jgi:transketolase